MSIFSDHCSYFRGLLIIKNDHQRVKCEDCRKVIWVIRVRKSKAYLKYFDSYIFIIYLKIQSNKHLINISINIASS